MVTLGYGWLHPPCKHTVHDHPDLAFETRSEHRKHEIRRPWSWLRLGMLLILGLPCNHYPVMQLLARADEDDNIFLCGFYLIRFIVKTSTQQSPSKIFFMAVWEDNLARNSCLSFIQQKLRYQQHSAGPGQAHHSGADPSVRPASKTCQLHVLCF